MSKRAVSRERLLVLDAIGHTPIVRMSRLVEPGMAEVWVKLEPSTGANLVVALGVARELGQGRRVATVLVDSGLKNLGGSLYA
jgi:cysteine synthase